jgi:uncharacterized membrane protein YeaQ/YmgE (transglycosylase-associated protein family)
MGYVWTAAIGFVVGLVARAVLPGTQSIGIIFTAVLGVAGSFLAAYVGSSLGWYAQGAPAGFLASVLGAIVLLIVVSRVQVPGNRR